MQFRRILRYNSLQALQPFILQTNWHRLLFHFYSYCITLFLPIRVNGKTKFRRGRIVAVISQLAQTCKFRFYSSVPCASVMQMKSSDNCIQIGKEKKRNLNVLYLLQICYWRYKSSLWLGIQRCQWRFSTRRWVKFFKFLPCN